MIEADTVIETRKWLNLSQERLARLLGVSFATINRWERGHTAPSGILLELYRALDIVRKKGIDPQKIIGHSSVGAAITFARIFMLAYNDHPDLRDPT